MDLKLLFVIACLQASVSVLAYKGKGGKGPKGKYDRLPYEKLEERDGYEVRRYPAFKYAEASETGLSMNAANRKNFMKLFKYIKTNKIPMTIPVLCPLKKDSSGNYAKEVGMMFWLDPDFQANPPKPMDDQVSITHWGSRIAYVRTYGLWAIESMIKSNEDQLRKSLKRDGVTDFNDKVVYSAQYNSPWDLFNRKNDVMFMKEEN